MNRFLWTMIFTVFTMMLLFQTVLLAEETNESKSKEPATKLEVFLSKKGELIIKEFYEIYIPSLIWGGIIGEASRMSIQALVIYKPGRESEAIKGLVIEIKEGDTERLKNASRSFLDMDEIESLSQALGYIFDLSQKWKDLSREAYTEVIFRTKDDFQIGFYQHWKKQTAFSTGGYINKASCYFVDTQSILNFQSLVNNGMKILTAWPTN